MRKGLRPPQRISRPLAVSKPRTTLQLRFLHQLRNRYIKRAGDLHESENCHIVVAPFNPAEIASIHVGSEGQIFLGNLLRFPNPPDCFSEGQQRRASTAT